MTDPGTKIRIANSRRSQARHVPNPPQSHARRADIALVRFERLARKAGATGATFGLQAGSKVNGVTWKLLQRKYGPNYVDRGWDLIEHLGFTAKEAADRLEAMGTGLELAERLKSAEENSPKFAISV
jgi:hypothetical protein